MKKIVVYFEVDFESEIAISLCLVIVSHDSHRSRIGQEENFLNVTEKLENFELVREF